MKIKIEEEIIFNHKDENLSGALGLTNKQSVQVHKLIMERVKTDESCSYDIEHIWRGKLSAGQKIYAMLVYGIDVLGTIHTCEEEREKKENEKEEN